MSTVNNNQPIINPHMKFTAPPKGVVQPPIVYSYSIAEDLKQGQEEYNQIIKSMNKSQLALFKEKHPNLKSNVIGVMKYTLGVLCACCGYRYRHSIPILKSFCKKPKKTPPKFLDEVHRIWNNITKK